MMSSPIISTGQLLQTHDDQLALCLSAIPMMIDYWPAYIQRWQYEMLHDGEAVPVSHDEVQQEIDQGGKVIIIDM
jgi:hypothetical protein